MNEMLVKMVSDSKGGPVASDSDGHNSDPYDDACSSDDKRRINKRNRQTEINP